MADDVLSRLADVIENLDASQVRPLVQQALDAGLRPAQVLNDGLSEGMRRVGAKFNTGEMFMPEVLVACDVYFAGLEVVRPLLQADNAHCIGTMVLGNIHGDVHTVGKNVAIPVFEASGLRVIDLGESASDEQFVEAIREHNPDIVGLGTYMTSTFMHTKATVQAIERAGLRDRVKIICGGPAVSPEAARAMGADDASDAAWKAVEKIKALLAARN
jgi:5-methyltetrahydrofolate--homocysteine methyltransferase